MRKLKGYQAISSASRKTNLPGDKVNELIAGILPRP
jgi:hypothetical protein